MASVLCVLLRTPRKRLGVLHLDRGPMEEPFTKDDLHLADALAAHVSAGIESAQLLRKQRELFYTRSPCWPRPSSCATSTPAATRTRVTEYSFLLGQQLELSAKDLDLIRIGTPLHDIGKIGIDDAILRKPGKLTPEEFEIMKTHTVKGAKILEQVAGPGGRSSRSCARITSAGTARAIPTAWPASRHRSRWPASSPWPTPSTR